MESPSSLESREPERMDFKPCVVVLYGPTMSGKTTTAERLASVSNFVTFDADIVKRELFANVPEPNRTEAAFYSAENTRRTDAAYKELVRRAIEKFHEGMPTALSGTFSFDSWKKPLADALMRAELPPDRVRIMLLAMPNSGEVGDRAHQRRTARGEPVNLTTIEGDVADYRKRAKLMTSWPEHVVVQTVVSAGGKDKVFHEILDNLKDLRS